MALVYEGEGASNELIFDSVDSTGASARNRRCAKAGQLTGAMGAGPRIRSRDASQQQQQRAWLNAVLCVTMLYCIIVAWNESKKPISAFRNCIPHSEWLEIVAVFEYPAL